MNEIIHYPTEEEINEITINLNNPRTVRAILQQSYQYLCELNALKIFMEQKEDKSMEDKKMFLDSVLNLNYYLRDNFNVLAKFEINQLKLNENEKTQQGFINALRSLIVAHPCNTTNEKHKQWKIEKLIFKGVIFDKTDPYLKLYHYDPQYELVTLNIDDVNQLNTFATTYGKMIPVVMERSNKTEELIENMQNFSNHDCWILAENISEDLAKDERHFRVMSLDFSDLFIPYSFYLKKYNSLFE